MQTTQPYQDQPEKSKGKIQKVKLKIDCSTSLPRPWAGGASDSP
jgi:hypothetical protein